MESRDPICMSEVEHLPRIPRPCMLETNEVRRCLRSITASSGPMSHTFAAKSLPCVGKASARIASSSFLALIVKCPVRQQRQAPKVSTAICGALLHWRLLGPPRRHGYHAEEFSSTSGSHEPRIVLLSFGDPQGSLRIFAAAGGQVEWTKDSKDASIST